MATTKPWDREELLLALDLYCRVGAHISTQHPDIIAVSDLLRRLPANSGFSHIPGFRSPSAVHLKLQNFLSVDVTTTERGLSHVAEGDKAVWSEFSHDHDQLSRIAFAIRRSVTEIRSSRSQIPQIEEFAEGETLFRWHSLRERDSAKIRRLKAKRFAEHGRLTCEVCDFDFESVYGKRGAGFIECHHDVPVSVLKPGQKTRIRDLSLVCSNCHQMIHRVRPWMSVAQLREHLRCRQLGAAEEAI